ncbi:methionine gamma-lyase [Paracoccus aminophilus]|uniref:L-methionine gamma-lyase n=1 Tax=Paracoccus aminophilus JCM 7686 TaxID=1367847 RepID=S5XZF0_PARAH|nr:methionine gamma-lyase [Paracoccus aminophilus]AGT10667.1 methionine-gamma-lyase [Paracoccus aminophilus JCM 7686]
MTETSRRNRQPGLSTRAIHLGYDPATENGALTPPIYMTSTYAFETAEQGSELFRGERKGYIYGRTKNPTQTILEERIASLEGGETAIALGSGMAAISGTMLSLLDAGDEVVIDHTLYGNAYAYFTQALPRWGISVKLADFTRPETLEAALGPKTKLVYFETPANPNLRVIDIAAVAAIAHAHGAEVVVDNTFATPILQRPLEHGADIVLHSATKYIGGHGDVLAGLVVGRAETLQKVRQTGLRWVTGATLSPFNCFLLLRGLKTLELRVERHSSSAMKVARLLEGHAKVASVSYPGLESFAEHEIAKRQMSGFGGLISFELDGGMAEGMALMNRLELVTRAVSLGDAETLIQHPASMTHAIYSAEEREKHGISDGLLRLSVGLENVDDILDDLERALDSL